MDGSEKKMKRFDEYIEVIKEDVLTFSSEEVETRINDTSSTRKNRDHWRIVKAIQEIISDQE